VRRYQKELDDFGYRRDNERIQPFLFAKYQDKGITFFGSVSNLRATFTMSTSPTSIRSCTTPA
jgi:hypothetical protein